MHFTFKLRDQIEGNCPSTYNKGGGSQTTVTESGLPKEFRPYIERALGKAEEMYNAEMAEGGARASEAYSKLGAAGERLGAEAAAERAALDQFKTEGAGAGAARGAYEGALGTQYGTARTEAAQDVLQGQMTGELGGADYEAAQAERRRQLGSSYDDVIAQDLAKTAGSTAFGMSRAGGLGSARAQMAQQGALADRALQLRQADDARRIGAAGALGQADMAKAQAEAQMRSSAAGTLYSQDIGRQQAEQAAQLGAAGALSGLDTSAQQRYLAGLQAGQGLGEQEYQAAKAGVASAEGMQDAPHRGLERYFGYLGSGALGQSSTSTQTGGGK